MIGLRLATLMPSQENRLLTTRFMPYNPEVRDRIGLQRNPDCGCLFMTAESVTFWGAVSADNQQAGWRYEFLCSRFGFERINAAIRNRILANQARRVLHDQEVGSPAS